MHANTYKSNNGYKTESFDKIIEEIENFFLFIRNKTLFLEEFILKLQDKM